MSPRSDIAPYIVEVRTDDGLWIRQDLVRGWEMAVNTAVRTLRLYPAARIKDRFGFVEAEYPTPKKDAA